MRAKKVELFYRCSDVERERLMRRQDGRDALAIPGHTIGDRITQAVNDLCDHIESGNGSLTIEPTATLPVPEKQRKAYVPLAVLDRVHKVRASLPGVSRDQLIREALRRATGAY